MSVKQFFGWLLVVIGVLIMLLSGGCSLYFLIGTLGADPGLYSLVLLFGGIPFLIGWGLYAGGRKLAGKKAVIEDKLDLNAHQKESVQIGDETKD